MTNTMILPSLPGAGPLRMLAVAGSIAIVAFLAALAVQLRARRVRDSAWAALPLGLCAATIVVGRYYPSWHTAMSIATAAAAGYDAWRFNPPARFLAIVGLGTWLTAMAFARLLFGR